MNHFMNHLMNRALGRVFLFATAAVSLSCMSCSPAPSLKAAKVAQTSVESTVSTTTAGTVDAQDQAVLSFGTVGRVEQVLIRAGKKVKRGQVLAKMENRDLITILRNTERELTRSRELLKEGLVSNANFDEAQRAFQVARSNLDKSEIRAPFDGVVTDVNLQVGELSQAQFPSDKPPVRIVDEKPRLIKGVIDEVDLSKVREGAEARVKISAVRPNPFNAIVTRVVRYVSTTREQERTAQIELEFHPEYEDGKDVADRARVPVGASAEIEVITASSPSVTAVPSRAVLGTGGARYVYRFEEGRIKKTAIKTGIGNYDRTEILEGLKTGDTVALPGDVVLNDGMKAKAEMIQWP